MYGRFRRSKDVRRSGAAIGRGEGLLPTQSRHQLLGINQASAMPEKFLDGTVHPDSESEDDFDPKPTLDWVKRTAKADCVTTLPL